MYSNIFWPYVTLTFTGLLETQRIENPMQKCIHLLRRKQGSYEEKVTDLSCDPDNVIHYNAQQPIAVLYNYNGIIHNVENNTMLHHSPPLLQAASAAFLSKVPYRVCGLVLWQCEDILCPLPCQNNQFFPSISE